jgi:osmotically-inducible protein OsmY
VKNDRQLQQDVLAALDRDPGVPTGTIGVEVHHGIVKLAGRVPDPSIRKNVELAAHRVDGVITVVMEVDITTGAGTFPRAAGATQSASRPRQYSGIESTRSL